jgi:hypothetical protein
MKYIQTLFGAIPSKSYHNTNKLTGAEHIEAEETAKRQEENTMALYREFRILSPSECWKLYKLRYNDKVLLTSIRRAITNLTVHRILGNRLIRTKVKRKGIYGKTEFLWKLNEEKQ